MVAAFHRYCYKFDFSNTNDDDDGGGAGGYYYYDGGDDDRDDNGSDIVAGDDDALDADDTSVIANRTDEGAIVSGDDVGANRTDEGYIGSGDDNSKKDDGIDGDGVWLDDDASGGGGGVFVVVTPRRGGPSVLNATFGTCGEDAATSDGADDGSDDADREVTSGLVNGCYTLEIAACDGEKSASSYAGHLAVWMTSELKLSCGGLSCMLSFCAYGGVIYGAPSATPSAVPSGLPAPVPSPHPTKSCYDDAASGWCVRCSESSHRYHRRQSADLNLVCPN